MMICPNLPNGLKLGLGKYQCGFIDIVPNAGIAAYRMQQHAPATICQVIGK